MKKHLLTILLLTILIITANAKGKYNLPVKELKIQKQDGTIVSVKAEIAKEEKERNYGFMNRKKIPNGTGMLFVFEYDQQLHFWMKNTPHPLSIAYITAAGKITDVLDMTPFSLASVSSSRSVRYALEVPQGWYDLQNITPGDTLILTDF